MTVSAIAAQALQSAPSAPIRVRTTPGEGGAVRQPVGPPFGETLSGALDRVDQVQKTSDAQVEAFIAGETENTHEVMIAMNQAELHFQLLTEVRNKLLDGYQELMRMQV